MQHHFNVEVARKFDVNIAILLDHLVFWTIKNIAKKKHFHDGGWWTYDTLDAFTIIFPYWNRRQIEHLINKAVTVGLITKGNYNATTYDRTCWYALTDLSYDFYPELKRARDESYPQTISQNCEMEITKLGNGIHKNVTPIPDTIPDNVTNINSGCINNIQNSEKSKINTNYAQSELRKCVSLLKGNRA